MKKIRGKKFTTIFLLALLCFSMVAGLFKVSLIFIPEVHATGGDSSLIGSLETIVNSVDYANDIDDVYQGMIVGESSMQQLINAYNALTTATLVFQWTPILSKLGYVNQTTIEWALDNQQMMSDGLPYTYLNGSKEAFLVYDRYMILAYGYAIQYNYDLAKWNLTQAYDSFKAAVVASTHPALLWMDQDGTPYTISYGPRYYDECGETIDCFLDFYNLGITAALNDSLSTWLWANNNLWSGTNYNYGLNWAGYECEAGGFLQIALKLWHADSLLPDTQNLIADLENRFLQEQFSSPQWLSGVVCHMAVSNPELRLENTVMAWAAILGSYGELSSTYQTDVQDMLTGAGGTTTPAWLGLLQSSLCGSDFPYFLEHSDDSGTSNYATATGADLLFMLGIVPQTASLAVPIEENSYEYIYNILDPELCNINLNTNVVTVSLAAAGTLNFQFNQTVTGSFGSPGIYAVQFSSDWNNLLNITFISGLPSNRQYMYTSPLSYYINSSADANGLISPSGSVVVNYGSDQVFTIAPNANYHVADVVVDGISVGALTSYVFANVTSPHTISASFAINSYTISVTQGADGQIAPGTTNVNYGNSQIFTITPAAGYSIASLMVDGSPVTVASSYTFSNVQAAHSITATFATNTYGVTVNVGTHGSSNLASQTADWNTALNFVFTPDLGYSVADVVVNGYIDEGAVASLSLTITGSTIVSVTFAINTYSVTVAQSTDGQIAPLTSVVTYGATPSFTITPNAGYHIASITANDALVNVTSPTGQTYQFNSISTDSSLTATFAINTYAITVTQTANGVISPNTVTANHGITQSFQITPATGHHITSVTVDGSPVAVTSSSGQTFSFTNIQANHTITATFAIDSFNITSSAGAGGSIGPSESISVNYGDNQTFAITPNTGYYIVEVRVNGSSVGAVSSYTFNNVQTAYTISATFALSPTIYWIAVAIVIGAIAAVVLYWSRKFDCA
ncbi:MAG: hypothetical protein ABSF44_01875 [Candidatus Bathyarchaeia archaeon]